MSKPRIVLAEWHWVGHHPTFFAYFIVALEDLGAEVLAICPKPDEARTLVADLRRDRGLDSPPGAPTTYLPITIRHRRFNHGPARRLSAFDWSMRHFRSIEALAKQWSAASNKKVDLIFYACMHEWDFDAFHAVQPFLSIPWSGLYLYSTAIRTPAHRVHGRLARPDKIFDTALCRAVMTFDEGITEQLNSVTRKLVIVCPDLVEERAALRESDDLLGSRLRTFANGRPTVGLCGYLVAAKGVVPLARVSQNAEMAQTCFAFAGEMVWSTFPSADIKTICAALSNGENVWNHLMRIPTEAQINSIISSCDVLYAAYLNFPNSSNIIAKAALFEKPLIVSEGHLMAERTRRFRLGEIIPQGDEDALVQAINRITRDTRAWVAHNQPRWAEYLQEHSYDRLTKAFADLLSRL